MTRILALVLLPLSTACGSPATETGHLGATYDEKTGRLSQLIHDANKNGKADSWSYMDGPKVLRVEIDRDEDGRIDRWEYYGGDQELEKVGLSRANDGKVDAWAYRGADGSLARLEISVGRDGTVTRTEFYEKGALVRSQEDTNGDRAIDKWETFADGVLTSVAFDTDGTGHPTRRLVYGSDGNLVRIERLR